MTRLRVGIDLTPLLGPPSGIHQVTRHLVEALGRRDEIDVRGWTLSARGGRPEVDVPVRCSRFPAGLAQRLWSRTAVPPARLVAGAVDVVHGSNFLAPPSPRSIISVQDLTPITRPEWVRPEVARMARPLRNALDAGATMHASSQAVADEASRVLDLDPSQIAVVHHAVGAVGPPNPDRVRKLVNADRFVLALGTVERRKAVPSLVEVIGALASDVHLVIAGAPGNDEAAVAEAIASSPVRERIHRLPEVSDPDRAALLHAATVLAFPSLYEGFGLPPLEAIQVGTPVVATAVGVLPELVSDRLELIPPGDTVALAEALVEASETASSDPELARRVESMTWDRTAGEMIDLYRSVASA